MENTALAAAVSPLGPSTSERLDEALRRLDELAGALPEGRLRDAVDDVAYGLACGVGVGDSRWGAVEVLTASMPWDERAGG